MSSTIYKISTSEFSKSTINSIDDLIGEWGHWQRRTVLLIFLCKIPAAWFMACIIYTAPIAQYGEFHCQQQSINMDRSIDNHTMERLGLVHPMKGNGYDFCNVYVENQSFVRADDPKIVPCESFEHESNFHSLVTQFDLVCSRSILIAVTQFSHLCGVLFGGITASKLLEVMSPKNVMLLGMITQIFSGCITGLVNHFWLHTMFRCFSAMCCALMYTAGLMIFSDITGGKYRISVICLFESFWGVGVILLPFIAYAVPTWSWKLIYLSISMPTIGYILIWPLIPDSPKWLLKHGQIDLAKNCLLHAIKMNGHTTKLPNNFDSFLQIQAAAYAKEPTPDKWMSLWSSRKEIFMMFALHTAWAVDVTNYNGMLLNIRTFGRTYLMLNTIICGISEIIGVLIAWHIVMNVRNHKFLCSGAFNVIAGALSFLGFLFPESLSEMAYISFGMTLAMLSVIATTCSSAILFTCTVELLPLTKQKICIFSCIVWARIWLLTAPFIGALTFIHNLFPLAAFGFIELCGGLCSCFIDYMHNRTVKSTKNYDIRNNIAETCSGRI